jgi:hypothetical protein
MIRAVNSSNVYSTVYLFQMTIFWFPIFYSLSLAYWLPLCVTEFVLQYLFEIQIIHIPIISSVIYYIPIYVYDLVLGIHLRLFKYIVILPSEFIIFTLTLMSFNNRTMLIMSFRSQLRDRAALLKAALLFTAADRVLPPTEITHVVYLIPKELIQTWTKFPAFEQVKDQLVRIDVNDLVTFSLGQSEVLFVSHKWWISGQHHQQQQHAHIDNSPDSPDNKVFNMVKNDIPLAVRYVWFDFTCVPSTELERTKLLLDISDFMTKSRIRIYHIDDVHKLAFESSVWCRLEMMTSQVLPTSLVTEDLKNSENLTMSNAEDLYVLIPTIIESAMSLRFIFTLVRENERLDIFISVLEYFIRYHNEGNSN